MLFIIGLLLGAVVVLFILQNVIPITVSFLSWQFDGTLAFILILAVVAGMLISALLSLPEMIRNRARFSHLRNHNRKLQDELELHKQLLSTTVATQPSEPTIVEKTTVVETTTQ